MTSTRARNRSKGRSVADGKVALVGMLAGTIVFVALVTWVLVASGGQEGAPPAGSDAQAVSAELTPTGEMNEMGMPIVETPGYASGTARAGGVTVQGAVWTLGQVPLNVAVRPFWTLTNTGPTQIALGEPQAEVREGCCPGPFALGTPTLAPGESTVLTFELAMHEGMDGWHDMGVYVPIRTGAGVHSLELNVTGDFRD